MEENLGLVRLCAHRLERTGPEYDDLYQAGCLGLLQAAERFDPSRGFRFSTYAVPLILGEMRKLTREGTAVRVSRGLRELAGKARQAEEDLRRERGASPGVEEVAARLGVSPERAAQALGAGQGVLSLSGEEGETLEIPVPAPEEDLTDRLALRSLLARLEPPDRELLRLRYFRGRTQTETGRALGMSQVQVSRREKKLLAQLRSQLTDG